MSDCAEFATECQGQGHVPQKDPEALEEEGVCY